MNHNVLKLKKFSYAYALKQNMHTICSSSYSLGVRGYKCEMTPETSLVLADDVARHTKACFRIWQAVSSQSRSERSQATKNQDSAFRAPTSL